jgi:hypothetical protein
MLRGTKPLAYFSDIAGSEPDCLVRYFRLFDRHVAEGRLIRREITENISVRPSLESRRIFYALPGHAWRIDAMLTLLREPGAWSRDRERRFGELLGYEGWQNEYWLEQHYPTDA